MRSKLLAHGALLCVALIYGANYTIAKVVLDDGYIQPVGFIAFRILSAAVLFNILALSFKKEKIARSDWKIFIFAPLQELS